MMRKWRNGLFLVLLLLSLALPTRVFSEVGLSPTFNTVPVQPDRNKKKPQNQKEEENKLKEAEEQEKILEAFLTNESPTKEQLEQAKKAYDKLLEAMNQGVFNTDKTSLLRLTIQRYKIKITGAETVEEKKEEARLDIEKAKNTKDLTDMAVLTSYMYVKPGWFGTEDPFPKVLNALVQGIFFLTKMVYVLVMIILEAVFSVNTFEFLDQVVGFSADLFNSFREKYFVYLGMILALVTTGYYLRYRRVPLRIFGFFLTGLVATFLYSKSSVSVSTFPSNIKAEYNLSKIVLAVNQMTSDLTADALVSFDRFNSENSSVTNNLNASNLEKVRDEIFDSLVYQPFLNLNFKDGLANSGLSEAEMTDKVANLIGTNGKAEDITKIAKSNESIEQLSNDSIGSKFIVAVASLLKAILIGFSLILLGLISLVFNNLVLILVVLSAAVVFVAMIPNMEHLLINLGKKIVQFTVIGGMSLFFVRAFLFIDSIVALIAGAINTAYLWKSLIHFLIWILIWKNRSFLFGLMAKGQGSIQELKQKAQAGLDNLRPPLPQFAYAGDNDLFNHTKVLEREITPTTSFEAEGGNLDVRETGLLSRAGRKYIRDTFDGLRYGTDEGADTRKNLSQIRKEDFRQRVADSMQSAKDKLVLTSGIEKIQSGLHDYVGDEEAPKQVSYQERQERLEKNRERKEEDRRKIADLREQMKMKRQDGGEGIVSSFLSNQEAKAEFRQSRLEEQLKDEIPSRSDNVSHPSRELNRKRNEEHQREKEEEKLRQILRRPIPKTEKEEHPIQSDREIKDSLFEDRT